MKTFLTKIFGISGLFNSSVKDVGTNKNEKLAKVSHEREQTIQLNKVNFINSKLDRIAKENEEEFKQDVQPITFEKNEEEILVLLADDNFGSLNMMEQDIKLITTGISIVQVNDEIKKKIEKIINSKFKFKIEKLSGDMVPFEIKQTSILNKEELKKVNIAILDIVFGGISIEDGETQILDGIDVAKMICEVNDDCVIVFYTGCNLSNTTEEYNKIQDLINSKEGIKQKIFFVDKDINDDKRISTISDAFYSLLNLE